MEIKVKNYFSCMLLFTAFASCNQIVPKTKYADMDKSEKKIVENKIDAVSILSKLDEDLVNNKFYLYPSFFFGDEYVYGKSRVSLLKSDTKYLILIEEIIFHTLGKISNQTYFYGSGISDVRFNSSNNIHYTDVVDYIDFEHILDTGFNEQNQVKNHRGEILYLKEGKSTYEALSEKSNVKFIESFIPPELFFLNFIENNPSDFFFHTASEMEEMTTEKYKVIDATEDWFYEDLTKANTEFTFFLSIKPSNSIVFNEAAKVLSGAQERMDFPKVNNQWDNWKYY